MAGIAFAATTVLAVPQGLDAWSVPAVGAAMLGWLGWGCRVVADDDGVTVWRALPRRTRITWDDVQDVTLAERTRRPRWGPVLEIRTKTGRVTRCWAVSRSTDLSDSYCQRAMWELGARVRA